MLCLRLGWRDWRAVFELELKRLLLVLKHAGDELEKQEDFCG